MRKKRVPLTKEEIEKIIERHKDAYKKLSKSESCDGCGCTPCDCGWGTEEPTRV